MADKKEPRASGDKPERQPTVGEKHGAGHEFGGHKFGVAVEASEEPRKKEDAK